MIIVLYEHCVDIYNTKLNGWEINNLLDSPFEFCKYCAFMMFNDLKNENYFYPWTNTRISIEDWVIK